MTISSPRWRWCTVTLCALVLTAAAAAAGDPPGIVHADRLVSIDAVPLQPAPPVDLAAVSAEDIERELAGLAPRFAIPNAVSLSPTRDGLWESLDDGTLIWRLRVGSPGAVSLNVGFTEFLLPERASLYLYASDGSSATRPITAAENASHRQFWSPVVMTDELIVEVVLPAGERDALRLELGSINVGYRGFDDSAAVRSGSCNVDVVCPDGNAWRDEIPAIAVISTGGSLFCSGFMVNNTAQDRTPYFMTAYHCGISGSNAVSLVAYWNYETTSCGGPRNGSLSQWQSGSFFRSRYSTSDFVLVELDSDPDPAWGITYAGWDRSGADAQSAVAIHHPSVDEKAISFEYQPTTVTTYLGTAVPGNGTHVRVADWDVGTTEGGSSGSPLFDQNHRVIGQLHGGYAACGNNSSDWYGRFAVSWSGGGSSATRLSDWLDPGGTGATFVDTLVPGGCSSDGECDDGAFCNGAETCSGSGTCQAGSDPCPGEDCDEGADICVPLVCDGDGTCESGEDCNNCGADCIAGSAGTCGNDVCETGAGEDCYSCPGDCNGVTNGKPSDRFCCGGDAGCSDSRCTGGGNTCNPAGGSSSYCCGDGTCNGAENGTNCAIDCGAPPSCGDSVCSGGETQCSCSADCGTPPSSEGQCTDGIDNDCDGATDAADSDCGGTCAVVGASCDADADCCSNKCRGPSGGKTCK